MGRLTRMLAAVVWAAGLAVVGADAVRAFDGFGELESDSTYGREIRFQTRLEGTAPERLELLLWTPGDESATVIPVAPSGGEASYVWDTSESHVTPNTLVTYRWRAIDGEAVTLSEEGTIRYEDDRPGLDWQTAQ
ncbi:MAG: hypothetical protein M3Y40_06660, partial [Chloroflexota bacterium]|nr:hypothetical protein [Chloroflexota bacterium]